MTEKTSKTPTPFIIPVFIPHLGCPHQCIFCDQTVITGRQQARLTQARFQEQVDSFLSYRRSDRTDVQIAFYGGNFLGNAPRHFVPLLEYAEAYVRDGKANGIRFSTRPETIQPEAMLAVSRFSVTTIELGVQSMDNQVLTLSNRGHTSADTERAVASLKEKNYRIGLQMMVGLPGDQGGPSLTTARELIRLSPDFMRIYPTVVLAGSPLADRFQRGDYHPLSLDESVTLVKRLYLLFKNSGIPVVRMGLQATAMLKVLAGPFHPAFGHLVQAEIFLDQAIAVLKDEETLFQKRVSLLVHPRSVARMRGEKNKNVRILKKMYAIEDLLIQANETVPEDRVVLGSVS